MKIGLIDVDGHNFPNLALMKISAYHKLKGDSVEWCVPLLHYDIVYQSKVFSNTYSPDITFTPQADKIIKGGTGYAIETINGNEVYNPELNPTLPDEIEHQYPDYSLYPEMTKDTAYGYLTRGCPRGCHFCIVAQKEGRCSNKVANLSEFWNGQKNIKLLDPNILACKENNKLLRQLIDSNANVDFTQGVDARLLNETNIDLINQIKLKNIHFAWDYMKDTEFVLKGLEMYSKHAARKPHGHFGAVYILCNYDTTMEENLYRIYTLRDLGYDPYVMIYNKPSAPKEIKDLQRWCNNKIIFRSCDDFHNYMVKD